MSKLVRRFKAFFQPDHSLNFIQDDIKAWADANIPNRTPAGQMLHLEKELNELKVEWDARDWPKMKVELADVVIIALNIAGQLDIDLRAEIDKKMAINKKRVWSKPDENGVIHHVD